jgi:Tfp pilus assembly protein PilN
MQDINLLRPQIERQQKVAKTRGRYSFYITFSILAIIIITGIIFSLKFYISRQTKSLDSQIQSLNQEVSEVKNIEDSINNFNSIIAQLKNVDKTKIIWSMIYDNIAKSTPTDVALTQVVLVSAVTSTSGQAASSSTSSTASKTTSTATASKLKITGVTASRRSIALFAYKLQKIGGNFVTVDIISTKKAATTSQAPTTPGTPTAPATTSEIVDFEINISLKATP